MWLLLALPIEWLLGEAEGGVCMPISFRRWSWKAGEHQKEEGIRIRKAKVQQLLQQWRPSQRWNPQRDRARSSYNWAARSGVTAEDCFNQNEIRKLVLVPLGAGCDCTSKQQHRDVDGCHWLKHNSQIHLDNTAKLELTVSPSPLGSTVQCNTQWWWWWWGGLDTLDIYDGLYR